MTSALSAQEICFTEKNRIMKEPQEAPERQGTAVLFFFGFPQAPAGESSGNPFGFPLSDSGTGDRMLEKRVNFEKVNMMEEFNEQRKKSVC